MKIIYPVIFTLTGDKKDTVLVEIPDLRGVTEGYGLADAISMARDYIGCALYDKSEYPAASSLDSIDVTKSEFAHVGKPILSIVDIDIDAYRKELDNKPVRRNVSLPNWLNRKANEEHINVSRVLQEALMEKMRV